MRNPSALRRLWWRIFGKPNAVLIWEVEERLRIEAERWSLPYHLDRFWPAARAFGRGNVAPGIDHHIDDHKMICSALYDARIGDVVPVFKGRGMNFMYRVDGFSWAGGDDHLVSPKQFSITFVRAEPVP